MLVKLVYMGQKFQRTFKLSMSFSLKHVFTSVEIFTQFASAPLRIILDNYTSEYETHLEKGKTSTMNIKRMMILATEIFKTVSNLNPSFMKDIFTSKANPKVRPNNLIVKRHNTTKYSIEQKVLQL